MKNIIGINIIFAVLLFLSTGLFCCSLPVSAYASSSAAEKEEIKVLKNQIKLEVEKLKKIEAKIHHIKAAQKAKVKSLVSLYSSMSPRNAANILPRIDKGVAIYILSHMTPRAASAIISRMPVKDAAFFTNSIAGK
ncbi:MAG: MotE family protein [bacterium]|jgi:flagellar motility protein MotE (MotC chaperone)